MSIQNVTTEELLQELQRRKNEELHLTVMLCESLDGRRWFETMGAIVNTTKVLDQVTLSVKNGKIEVTNAIGKTKITWLDSLQEFQN